MFNNETNNRLIQLAETAALNNGHDLSAWTMDRDAPTPVARARCVRCFATASVQPLQLARDGRGYGGPATHVACTVTAGANESEETTMATKDKGTRKGQSHKGTYTLFGHPVTAVLRTMGKMGMHHTTAITFLGKHKVSGVSEATVKTGVAYGRNPKCSRPYADLDADQKAEVKAAIEAHAAAVKEAKAAKAAARKAAKPAKAPKEKKAKAPKAAKPKKASKVADLRKLREAKAEAAAATA